MYSAVTVAKYVIFRCHKDEYTISNLKLQKLLYFVQAEFLVDKNEPCFGEKIEAWDFGPVVPEVYQRFKIYGSANIPFFEGIVSFSISEKDKRIIDEIIKECAKYSAASLVEITHNQSPWKEAYRRYQNAEITQESIKRFFKES